MENKSFTNLFNKYYKISILVVLIIGITASYLTYKQVAKEIERELLTNVSVIANTLNKEEIQSLNGNLTDLENPNYLSIKEKLIKINTINPENRFIYLWIYQDDSVVFLVDSELPTSLDYSPPGQIYEEATDLDKRVLNGEVSSSIEFSSDRWGDWLTALVPILDDTGEVISVLGIDMEAEIYYNNIYRTVIIPILSTIFVLIIILIGLILRKREDEYLILKEKLLSTARHELRAPLTGLSWLTEALLNNKKRMNDEDSKNIEIVHTKVQELIKNVNEIIEKK